MQRACRPGWRTALSGVVVALTVIAALGGILSPDLYQEPSAGREFSRAYWYADDLVTLSVAAPLLAVSRMLADRGSWRAELIWSGSVYYVLYNYLFYLFGATLNWFFPVYVALVTVTASILVLTSSGLDPHGIPACISLRRRPATLVGCYLALLGTINVMIWSAEWVSCLSDGRSGTVHDEFVRTVAGVDLPMLAVAMVVSATGLWRRRPWGLRAAITVSTGIGVYMVVLAVAAVANAQAGLAGASTEVPQWVLLGVGCLTADLALLRAGSADIGAPAEIG